MPHISPHRIDSFLQSIDPIEAVFPELELVRAIQELESAAALAPEGDPCQCGHTHCDHVVPPIPHPIVEDTLAEDTIDEFLRTADVLSVPRAVAKYFTQDILLGKVHVTFSEEDAKRTVLRANLLASNLRLNENSSGHGPRPTFKDMPLIWDTGASSGLTPFRSDFLTYEECDIPIKDVSQVNRVKGMGLAGYQFKRE